MNIDATTKLGDLIDEFPALKTDMAKINPKFKMLQTPMGKVMMKKATIADMSERSGMPIEKLIAAIAERIGNSSDITAEGESEESQQEPQAAWWGSAADFKTIDVRNARGNFFPGLKKRAEQMPVGEGLHIVQSFEPIPLYDVMAELGYERITQRGESGEYHVYFYRVEEGVDSEEIAFRPIALLNFPIIDEELGDVAVNFWNLTWNDEKRYLSQEMRLLLSMANALGAGRMRQASRELIKVL
jgi:hypothetical protein